MTEPLAAGLDRSALSRLRVLSVDKDSGSSEYHGRNVTVSPRSTASAATDATGRTRTFSFTAVIAASPAEEEPHHRDSCAADGVPLLGTLPEVDSLDDDGSLESLSPLVVRPRYIAGAAAGRAFSVPALALVDRVTIDTVSALETPRAPCYAIKGEKPAGPLHEAVQEAVLANKIDASKAGKSGSYWIGGAVKLALFKPRENALGSAISRAINPKYLRSKDGIKPEESPFLELVASKMDQKHGGRFHVPFTWFAEAAAINFSHKGERSVRKEGSFQAFVPNCRTFESLSEAERGLLSKDQLELQAGCDISWWNADRIEENLLVAATPDGSLQLVSVDHGCILPRKALSGVVLCYKDRLYKPMGEPVKAFIDALSSEPLRRCFDELASQGFVEAADDSAQERLYTHEAAIAVLKMGKAHDLTLYDIAVLCQDDTPLLNPLATIIRISLRPDLHSDEVIREIIRRVEILIEKYKEKKPSVFFEDPTLSLEEWCVQAKIEAMNELGLIGF